MKHGIRRSFFFKNYVLNIRANKSGPLEKDHVQPENMTLLHLIRTGVFTRA